MIYLDHNSTTPFSPKVAAFIQNELVKEWTNPSSSNAMSYRLSNEIRQCRSVIASFIGASPAELIFTSGATESINTVLSPRNLHRYGVRAIVSSRLEHKSTLDSISYLEELGFEVHWVNSSPDGELDLDEIRGLAKTLPKALFTFLMVNNETGVIHPVQEISAILKDTGHLLHLDAVQALGKHPVSLNEWNVDFASFSGHKIGSLKGIGLLFVRNKQSLAPLINGGGQENGHRSGTLNYAGIRTFKLAVEDASVWDLNSLSKLKDYLEYELSKMKFVRINCRNTPRVCNTTNITISSSEAVAVFEQLSAAGICVSSGSACSSSDTQGSHVLRGLGLTNKEAISSLRISIGVSNTKEEVDQFLKLLRQHGEKHSGLHTQL